MAVLFPTPFGTTLSPKQPAQLLQAFLNIQNVEGVTTGELTKADLVDYGQKRFLALDPSHAVAAYLTQDFDKIARIDGNANSISASDLVKLRGDLPDPDHVVVPPQQPAPSPPPITDTRITFIFFFLINMINNFFSFRRSAL